jgi:hypothetical protein
MISRGGLKRCKTWLGGGIGVIKLTLISRGSLKRTQLESGRGSDEEERVKAVKAI